MAQPAGPDARLPDAHCGAREAVERAVRRRNRAARQRRHAARARAQQPVRRSRSTPSGAGSATTRLFRAMLLRQLERYAPEAVADLHRGRARGSPTAATSAARSSTPSAPATWRSAADTLQRSWLALYSDGQANAAVGWIDRLPADTIADYPELALARGGDGARHGPVARGGRAVARAGRASRRACPERDAARELMAGVARRDRCSGSAMLTSTKRCGWRGRRRAAPARFDGGAERLLLPCDLPVLDRARRREAEQRLREYLAATPPGERDVHRVFAMAVLAEAHAVRGELDVAERLAQESLPTTEARGQASIRQPSRPTSRTASCCSHAVTSSRPRIAWSTPPRSLAAAVTGSRSRMRCCGWAAAEHARATRREPPTRSGPPAPTARRRARRRPRRAHERHRAGSPPPAGVTGGGRRRRRSPQRRRAPRARAPAEPPHLSRDRRPPLPVAQHVRTHSQRIRRKLGASTRGEAVSAARRLDLIQLWRLDPRIAARSSRTRAGVTRAGCRRARRACPAPGTS